jgi:hypothetical protein
VPYSLLTFWWFLFPSVHSSSLSLFESAASLEKRTVLLVVVTLLPLVEGEYYYSKRKRKRKRERKEERVEMWRKERKKVRNKQTKTKPKRNKEKNFNWRKNWFFLFCLFSSLFLSFFLSFFPETLRYLLFTRVHTVITYFNRTYIFHFEREREGERGRKNLRGGEL